MRSGTGSAVARAVVSGLVAALAMAPAAVAADDDWKVKWDNGFKVESADGDFKLKFGGRLQADWTFVDPDADLEAAFPGIVDGNEFRRARLFFSGTVYEKVEFKAQYDFAGGETDIKDLYVGVLDTPVGNIRVGHFKEPFSLEELTSSKYITFLEQALPVEAFAPSRNTGIMLHDHRGDRLTWAVGAFRESDDFGVTDNAASGKLNVTARVTGLPLYEEDGRRMIHVGAGVSQKDFGVDEFRFRARAEVHQLEDRFVDTDDFAAEEVNLYNLELAGVFDRFWFAAEHIAADADASLLGDPGFDGMYVQAGVFLTGGDYRRYKTSAGAWDRMKPGRNFGQGGPGAIEIAARYSSIDLSDGLIAGGEQDNLSLALNWYLNPVTRCMINWVRADVDGVGEGDFFLARVQLDF